MDTDHKTIDLDKESSATRADGHVVEPGHTARESGHLPEVSHRSLLDAANALTLLGLVFAVACAMLAINLQLAYAIVALMLAGVCDLFDGVVARRCQRSAQQQAFGGRLDSIVDACSFGFAPVVLAYTAGLRGMWEIPLLVFFSICVAWRLAYFDTVGLQQVGQRRYFVGLPVTYVSVFLPLACLPGFYAAFWFRGSVAISMFGMSLAMISRLKIRKPSGVFYLLFPAAGLLLAFVYIIFADKFIIRLHEG